MDKFGNITEAGENVIMRATMFLKENRDNPEFAKFIKQNLKEDAKPLQPFKSESELLECIRAIQTIKPKRTVRHVRKLEKGNK